MLIKVQLLQESEVGSPSKIGGVAKLWHPRSGGNRRFPWHLVIFLAPAAVIYTAFMVYPLVDSLRLSLYNNSGSYIGLDNFRTLLGEPVFADRFWNALRNNFVFFAFHCLVQNPVGLALAALLTAKGIRGQHIYRTVIFLPTTLSVVIVGFIWRQILSPLWGINDSALLGESSTVLPTLSLISVWQFVGIPMIFFYAVLISIPDDLIEAARVDGANGWRIFWSITFPLLLPTLGIITVVTFIANFNAFDLIYTVKGALAGPEYSSDIMGTFFYRTFFGNQLALGDAAMGATVASAMFFVILIGVLAYMLLWQRRITTYQL